MVSAVVLNWNELHIVKHTIDLLLQEQDVEIIVVDNASHDGSAEYLTHLRRRPEYGYRVKSALLDRNYGTSIARNIALDIARGEDIFLIDGDILYVPGTIPTYQRILRSSSIYGCVGYNDHQRVQLTGMNGVDDQAKADKVMPSEGTLSQWFPMAWTQYGLFQGCVLKSYRFYDRGCFGEYGHGYEDDWLYHEMRAAGYKSVAVNAPLYLHDGHYSLRLFNQMGLPSRTEERAKVFHEKWGEDSGWMRAVANTPDKDKVPFATFKVENNQLSIGACE